MRRQRGTRHLLLAAGLAVLASLGMGTLAQAQGKPEQQLVNVGGKLMRPPTPDSQNPQFVRGPDGTYRPRPGLMIGVVGPDGETVRNPDGSPMMVPHSNPTGEALLIPGSPEHDTAVAKAKANGIQPGEVTDARGERVPGWSSK